MLKIMLTLWRDWMSLDPVERTTWIPSVLKDNNLVIIVILRWLIIAGVTSERQQTKCQDKIIIIKNFKEESESQIMARALEQALSKQKEKNQ